MHKILWNIEIQINHLILTRRFNLVIVNKKMRTCQIAHFAVLVDHRVKLKENKKQDKYLDLARVLKKLWNKKVIMIPIVICMLVTVTKRLVSGVEDLEIRG